VNQGLAGDEELNFQVDQQIDVVLFFQSPARLHWLVPVHRKIYNVISIDQQANQVIQQLISGPESGEGAIGTIPPRTKLNRLYISREGIAYVIFNEAMTKTHIGGTAAELITIYSIVDTLCVNFPSIRAVQIIVDGATDSTLAGHVDISYPLFLDTDYFSLPPARPEDGGNTGNESTTTDASEGEDG
jgi:spore germination protein GerM